MTPEGKVKKDIKAYLATLGRHCRYFMPQNMGMGESGVSDIIGVYKGRAFALEVKSEDGRATPWQIRFLVEWRDAGGVGGVVRSVEDVRQLMEGL